MNDLVALLMDAAINLEIHNSDYKHVSDPGLSRALRDAAAAVATFDVSLRAIRDKLTRGSAAPK